MPEFNEYPKRVYPDGGKGVRVLNEAEETAALKGVKAAPNAKEPKAATSDGAKPDRKAMIAEAKKRGIPKPTFMSNADLAEALA